MLRRKAEVKLIKEQFSFLMQNRAEFLGKNREVEPFEFENMSPSMSHQKMNENSIFKSQILDD